jgi:uncharacterized protein YjiS (DUF1127 family)
VARRFVAIMRAWRNRKDLILLASFDDRMLADIGLSRGDVRDAASVPPWRDPTAILVSRAGERRRARSCQVSSEAEVPAAPPIAPEIDAWPSQQAAARARYY